MCEVVETVALIVVSILTTISVLEAALC
jgi:hypothetical protein